jgi:hypothetical protein
MSKSRNSSREVIWDIDQPSTLSTPSLSIDTSSFLKALDRYESEANSIQITFQALCHQLQKSPSTPHQLHPSFVTEQMIANVQERLIQLDRDRQELNEQLRRFTSISDPSSFLSHDKTPSRSRSRLSSLFQRSFEIFPELASVKYFREVYDHREEFIDESLFRLINNNSFRFS